MNTSKKPLKAGIIGTGGISGVHLDTLKRLDSLVDLTSGCDIDPVALRQKSLKYSFKEYSSYKEMIDREELDFVLLCTPQMERKGPIEFCVEKNIPIFTEKPPAPDLATAEQIESFTRGRSTPISVAFVFRYMPIVKKALDLLKGRKILLMDIQYLCPMMYPDQRAKDFFYDKNLSGGLVMDQAIHFLDLARFILKDEISETHAFGANLLQEKTDKITTEESVSINMRSAAGSLISYLHTWTHRKWASRMEIFAPDARIMLDFIGNTLAGTVDEVDVSYTPVLNGNIYYEELKAFIDYLPGGDGQILSTYSDSVKTMRLADAVMRSLETGKVVKIEQPA